MLNLVLCSHLFYNLGIPYLYRDLEPVTTRSWMTYIKATLRQPDLASYTKSINLSMNRYSYFANPAQLSNWPETGILSAHEEEMMQKNMDLRTIGYQTPVTDFETSHDSEILLDDLRINSTSVLESDAAVESNSPVQKESRISKMLRSVAKWKKKPVPGTPPIISLEEFSVHFDEYVKHLPVPLTATQNIVHSALSGNEQSAIIYLIYRLPNLESISLTLEAGVFARKSAEIISILNPDLINIPHLQHFTLNYSDQHGAWPKFNNFFPLLLQPSMRSFSGSNILERNWLPTPHDAKLTLTHLSFVQTCLCKNSLEAILKCCPQLESFQYEQAYLFHEHPFMPSYIVTSLRHVSRTLRHLTLHHPEGPMVDDTHHRHRLQFNTLEEVLCSFQVLCTLDITAHLLLGPQEHPNSRWWLESLRYTDLPTRYLVGSVPQLLESLTLRDCAENVLDEARELALCSMPLLKKIELHFLLRGEMPGSIEGDVWEDEVVGSVHIRSYREID